MQNLLHLFSKQEIFMGADQFVGYPKALALMGNGHLWPKNCRTMFFLTICNNHEA